MNKIWPLSIGLIALVLSLGVATGWFIQNLPKYENAIVQGTVVNSYAGSDIRPGFSNPPAWYLNISLASGTNGNLTLVPDTPCQGTCQPQKLNGIWYYTIIVNCDLYKLGDSVYLRIPIYTGGNVWQEERGVQGYNYHHVGTLGPTYDYPRLYKGQGIGFMPVDGCT